MRLLPLVLGLSFAVGAGAQSPPPGAVDVAHRVRQAAWPSEVVDAFTRLPVQGDGRVKPLSSVAEVALLSVNGNRELSVTWSDERRDKLGAVAWLLDCFFYPEQARHYRCLRVENSEAIDAIGLRFEGRSRLDRYSFEEILPAQAKLFEFARQYRAIEPKARTALQGQVLALAESLQLVDRLLGFAAFARSSVDVHRTDGLKAAFPGEARRPMSFVLENLVSILAMRQAVEDPNAQVDAEKRDRERSGLRALWEEMTNGLIGCDFLALLPPSAPNVEAWARIDEVIGNTVRTGKRIAPEHLAFIRHMEALAAAPGDAAKAPAAAQAALTSTRALAEARGEYGKVGTEVALQHGDYFYRALLVFGAAFLLAALWWLWPQSRLLRVGLHGCVVVAIGLVVTGITLRCMIRGKPPVTTLYETILFITAVGCLVGWVLELINRQRVAVMLAATLGFAGMFLARRFEELEAVDTLRPLMAVLDTNFWLATHVTSVTMGYSAGLLASLIAHVYVFARLFRASQEFTRNLARMIYGVLCFGLLFSVVGTILGGIWANDSWGRFWGWDPKENGALLICLSQIAILHGRLAGWLRDQGLAMAVIAGGVVVGFSWWHVNQLGVGLHAYGFTRGVLTVLYGFYTSQVLMLGLGAIASTRQPRPVVAPQPVPGPTVPVGVLATR